MSFHERKEFDKYLKFLTAKVAQTVVQSRQGRRIRTRSAANGNDWFNLAIQDDKQVSIELKRSLEGRLPEQDSPVCIEILMDTPEGDSIVLETWVISVDNSSRDISVSINHLLYPRLSLMLKSVISLSRTTPAYRYSRKTEDENKFNFRVYTGTPDVPNYLQDFKHVKFASTACPYCTVSLTLSYRTSLTFNSDRSTMMESVLPSRQISSPKDVMESGSLRRISVPFASDHHKPPDLHPHSHPGHPFSAVLPREIIDRQESGGTENSERGSFSDRQDSLIVAREPEDFVMVDLGEIKPAFATRTSNDELSDFLQQCKDEPSLDLFSEEESMDVTAALKLVESHSSELPQNQS